MNPMGDLVAAIAALNPPPTSANDAYRRLGGRRVDVLLAYREWCKPAATQPEPVPVAAPVESPVDAAAERERARRRAWRALDEWPP